MSYDSKPPSIGMWKNDRGPIATGISGGIRFVLWENDKRGNDRAPDYRLVLEAPQKREDSGAGGGPQRGDAPTSGAPAGAGGMPDDSIPF